MSWVFVKAYWKQLLIVVMLAALVIGACVAWVQHGDARYKAGYAKAQADQIEIDDKARSQREQEKTQIERDALSRIESARADADFAAASSGRLQSELDKIKRFAEHYTGTFPTGTPASKVISVLADMLEESNRTYIETAEEAERYRVAGESCEQQYDALKKRGTVNR
ncbi:TPA: DUF2514 family protein [Escherichia coli]|jgi:hypothetical protein|uniref:DUF2514 family protein n=1 Tax=Escherichia TaxID=561 RepID=UPI000FBCC96C|nr:DUF2514 family protein [Escherichia coli]MEC5046426.1 DUF2514 family protein [Escherichia coli]MEC5082609.1 DUF2514 family protein [Escherichia coli]MEC5087192.1 DUF2514 family protein [Escherichia coli]MIB12438.1 DUF2514 family protein [Escherichia coli]HDP9605165.1 DUF2514 family protein [Escherichia coli]